MKNIKRFLFLFSMISTMTLFHPSFSWAALTEQDKCLANNVPAAGPSTKLGIACTYEEGNCEFTASYYFAFRHVIDCAFEKCNCGSMESKDLNCSQEENASCVERNCKEQVATLAEFGRTIQNLTVCTIPLSAKKSK